MKFGRRRNRKTYVAVLCAIILAIRILSFCIAMSSETGRFRFEQAINPSTSLVVQYESLVYEEDLIVSGNDTRTIEDCEYDLIGNVEVKDNATLIIRNAVFNQTGRDVPVNITVKNSASLFLTNATLRILQKTTSRIFVGNEAKMDIANSNIENTEYDISIWAEDSSKIHIENSVMKRAREDIKGWIVQASTVVCDDNSEVEVKNLTLDRVTVYGNSEVFIERATLRDAVRIFGDPTVQVSDSTVGYVTADGNPLVYIRNSMIESDVRSGGYSDVWLIRATVQNVSAGGNSEIWLIDASVGTVYLGDNATFYMGWELPIFGIVAVPYKWVPFVKVAALMSIGAVAFVVFFVVMRKLQKRRPSEAEIPD